MKILSLILTCFGISFSLAYDGSERDHTGCPKVFREKCKCGLGKYPNHWKDNSDVYIVKCVNSGFHNETEMLEFLPDETQVLLFNGNYIPVLPWNIFGFLKNHEKLEVVDLSNNSITDIPGKAFHKVKYVKVLLLNHNQLIISGSRLHERVFSNFESLTALHLTNTFTEIIDSKLTLSNLRDIFLSSSLKNLTILHLEQNEIWNIKDDDMFCLLPSLKELYLADNQLQDINFSLDCLNQLIHLDLRFNKIKRLSNKTLDMFDKVHKKNPGGTLINLKRNPFECDCYMQTFQNWLKNTQTQIIDKNGIVCFHSWPETNQGKAIIDVDQFDCPPKVKNQLSTYANHHSTLTNALLTFLVFCVLALIVIVISYNRQKLSDTVAPLVGKYQKSMQYKTLNKNEITQTHIVNANAAEHV